MGKPYSDDLRERVVAAIEAGHTRVKVAELYNMALSTVGGFIKRKRETGSVSPDKFGGHKTFALGPHTALVKELVAEQPEYPCRASSSLGERKGEGEPIGDFSIPPSHQPDL
jgi:transposase